MIKPKEIFYTFPVYFTYNILSYPLFLFCWDMYHDKCDTCKSIFGIYAYTIDDCTLIIWKIWRSLKVCVLSNMQRVMYWNLEVIWMTERRWSIVGRTVDLEILLAVSAIFGNLYAVYDYMSWLQNIFKTKNGN